ncbi:hypothetical protein Drorol1_Dr00022184 [Drosera rotundifolia]
MPAKRSRLLRSSSIGCGDIGGGSELVESPPPPPTLQIPSTRSPIGRIGAAKAGKPGKGGGESEKKAIFSIASPVMGWEGRGEGGEEGSDYLDKCWFCGKNLGVDSEIFMYGYLRAFCNAECREIQIAMDEDSEKKAGKIPESIALQQGSVRTKDQFGSKPPNQSGAWAFGS